MPWRQTSQTGANNEMHGKVIFQGKQDRNFCEKASFIEGLEGDKRWVWGEHELVHCSLKKGH